MRTCPRCGSIYVEELGNEPGDINWYMCTECGMCWDGDQNAQRNESDSDPARG